MPNTLVLRDSKLLASVALVGMGTVEVMKVYSNGGQCQILSNRDDKPKRQRKGYTSYAAKPCEASRNCQSSTKSDEHLARPSEQAAHSAGPTKAVHPNGKQQDSSLHSRITESVSKLATRISPRANETSRINP
ncbi:hypothetical protein PCASD_08610 [Puccinia coronata f. sp. avenae]|uniref:Uncharacterized protein n=1 Tax=Puccinia coronata f. sp. avenae TaxID=200324 RepID=A0A2N5UBV4_9BASI|nr:hypothetical protein PCASD_08610 [Puccinia coronata f. sp. avenae]